MSAPHRLKSVRNGFKTKDGKVLSGISVAKKLGITPQYYYDIEKGERTLSADMASRLADIFNTTTDYLLGKTDVKESPSPHVHEKELFNKSLELSDEDIKDAFEFKVDGRELTEEEYHRMIAAVRAERLYRDQSRK